MYLQNLSISGHIGVSSFIYDQELIQKEKRNIDGEKGTQISRTAARCYIKKVFLKILQNTSWRLL